jgi:hypothetical protein
MPIEREQNAISWATCSISTAIVDEKNMSLKIVIMEQTANRRLDVNTGNQNDFPTFRCLIFFIVLQLSTHKRTAIKPKVMFETMINQFIHASQIFFIKI